MYKVKVVHYVAPYVGCTCIATDTWTTSRSFRTTGWSASLAKLEGSVRVERRLYRPLRRAAGSKSSLRATGSFPKVPGTHGGRSSGARYGCVIRAGRSRDQKQTCPDDDGPDGSRDALTGRCKTFDGDGCRHDSIARRSMTPMTSRITIRPAQQWLQWNPRRRPCRQAVPRRPAAYGRAGAPAAARWRASTR